MALTPEDLTRAAAAHIDPERFLIVIVGRIRCGSTEEWERGVECRRSEVGEGVEAASS